MASPESSGQIRGARAKHGGGGGVKNLLAMFEKGSSPPTPPGPAPPITRELSPGPKPLSRVRTSFVAVGAKDGVGFGLQKLSMSPSSPAIPGADATPGASPFGPALTAKVEHTPAKRLADPPKKDAPAPVAATTAKVEGPKIDRAIPALSVPATKTEPERSAPAVEEPKTLSVPATKTETKKVAPAVEEPPAVMSKVETKPAKEKPATKEQPKKEKAAPKTEASGSKTQTKQSSVLASKASKPATKNLTVPAAGRKTPSPLPSTRSPTRAHTRTPSAPVNSPTPKKSMAPPAPKPVSKPPTKPRQPVLAAPKPKPVLTHKLVPKPDPKEATKPAELKGSAFAPTASWVAKQGGVPVESVVTRRPPSAAAATRTSSSTERDLRRQKSTISEKDGGRSSRPASAAAHHTPAPSSDFLSRMMRPTKSSASKVHERVESSRFQPALRAGSAMGRMSVEPTSPPRSKPSSFGSSPKRNSREIPSLVIEAQPGFSKDAQSPTRRRFAAAPPAHNTHSEASEEAIPEEQEEEAVRATAPQHVIPEEEEADVTPAKNTPELTISTLESSQDVATRRSRKDDDIDEGHTPTTTSSSTTLVHDGEVSDVKA